MLLEQQQQGLRREKEQAEAAVAEIRSQMVEASKVIQ